MTLAEALTAELLGGQDRLIDIVFIHGLTGNNKTTWQRDAKDEASFWPKWVVEDHPYCRVICVDYPASAILWFSDGADMTLVDRGPALTDYLLSYGLGERPIIFIAHSLGGLLTKQILRICTSSADPRWKQIAAATWGVIFLGTPHVGSKLSNFASLIPGLRPSNTSKQLQWADDKLRDLRQWYSDQAPQCGYRTKAYAEKLPTPPFGVRIVDEISADPNVHGCNLVGVDEDHSGICKPSNRNAAVYRGAHDFIQECHLNCERKAREHESRAEEEDLLAEEYEQLKSKKQDDRLDLTEKLEQGNRAHEVDDALRKKENFAKNFQRRGLQSTAVQRYVRVLNDIESRFNRLVYPLIVAGRDHDTVNAAIQAHVVDPILDKNNGGDDVINNATIERMIYYLTGQCYIRWHHE